MISVIDIGLGNINSISKALDYLSIPFKIANSPDSLSDAEKIIFPGVGSFNKASTLLKQSGLDLAIKERTKDGVPYLGICLGMHLLAQCGVEGGMSSGLGIVEGDVVPLDTNQACRLPHIGWNDVTCADSPLYHSLGEKEAFYFAHSFCLQPTGDVLAAHSTYGIRFCASISKGNVHGVQFHPEKSQRPGLQLVRNVTRTKSTTKDGRGGEKVLK